MCLKVMEVLKTANYIMDPTKILSSLVRRLVLQSNVFAIFDGHKFITLNFKHGALQTGTKSITLHNFCGT